ncbi:16S rRNA (cytosine(1402)-N(4))-methyltransferase [Candidatus Kuenenbacteria bacterium HGW-Kuenenbacteria-1]|uniref:Ribosomal RNA small subunit methyltransferase H n=1 Tax=Candidatus Kuenenbacteria bacterium HGW-Kuenenbacteria-1 TaxID=2013812 RepID=A0A2N1UNX2_9BACT|nr:MAG: 16S rRNA (cytosine(1402)-N(4))-methyltransferase [Candidatus Kuenenbacteria bacterium HGW-Kuenenbacteria-1]
MHIPVLLNEVIENLNIQPNQNFIDCTFGDGGHTMAILKKNKPNGIVVGIDLNIKKFEAKERLILINDNFANLGKIIDQLRSDAKFQSAFWQIKFHGILLDLGFSSRQLEEDERGFSFQKDEFLDMRFNKLDTDLTAEKIINTYPEKELANIFWKYGEEKYSRYIAKIIIQERKKQKIYTTKQLADLIYKISKLKTKNSKFNAKHYIHPATKVFQALRIIVNNELENLKQVLPQAIKILEPKGKICVISFHSLEDRIVKQFFKQESKNCICPSEFPQCICNHKTTLKIITKKIIVPTFEEIKKNPRSRSAKMRVAEKLAF